MRPRSGVNGMGGSLRTPCLSRPSLARRETGDTASEPHPIHLPSLTPHSLTRHVPFLVTFMRSEEGEGMWREPKGRTTDRTRRTTNERE